MRETPGSLTVSMKLQRIAEQAKRYPAMVFNNVFHLIDREFLLEAYRQTRKSSAPGVDQVTATQYADNLDDNLRDLHERLRDNRYVAPPVGRVWIEKDDGKQRPIGKPCFEDKIVQRAVVMILEAIFDQDFGVPGAVLLEPQLAACSSLARLSPRASATQHTLPY
jgi:RNA-directed DNA polymerase